MYKQSVRYFFRKPYLSAGRGDVWLIRTDENGNILWDKTFGDSNEEYAYSVQQITDGGFVITGYAGFDIWLIRTDANGNKIWDKTFHSGSYSRGRSVRQTSDGGFIIAGIDGTGYYNVWLIRTDADGNKVWDKTFGGARMDRGYSVQQTTDNGFIIVGSTESYGAGYSDIWLIRTDSDGNKIWDKTFGGVREDRGYSVQQTIDEGFVITGIGTSESADYIDGSHDVWLIRTDASGNKIWDKTFYGTSLSVGNAVQQTIDGGFIITGTKVSYVSGRFYYDVWLLKTDKNGNVD